MLTASVYKRCPSRFFIISMLVASDQMSLSTLVWTPSRPDFAPSLRALPAHFPPPGVAPSKPSDTLYYRLCQLLCQDLSGHPLSRGKRAGRAGARYLFFRSAVPPMGAAKHRGPGVPSHNFTVEIGPWSGSRPAGYLCACPAVSARSKGHHFRRFGGTWFR